MGFLLAGIIAALSGPIVLKIALARVGRLPARSLPDNSGHSMVHASLDKCLAVLFASVIILGFTAGIYRAWQIESWGAAIYIFALSSLLGWVAFLNLRRQGNIIELTDSAISWRRGSSVTVILWPEVSGFAEAPSSTAWIVRSRDGRMLRVDRLLVGASTTFVDYLRKHLPPALFDTALAYVKPMTALRARIQKQSTLD